MWPEPSITPLFRTSVLVQMRGKCFRSADFAFRPHLRTCLANRETQRRLAEEDRVQISEREASFRLGKMDAVARHWIV